MKRFLKLLEAKFEAFGENSAEILQAVSAGLDEIGIDTRKEISLDDELSEIRGAFYDMVGDNFNGWVQDVYEAYLIAEDNGNYSKYPYSKGEEGEVMFGAPVEVEMVFKPKSLAITIKSITDTDMTLGGYGVVWGGFDLVDDFFTKSTDFWFDRITETPMVLYDHGQDEEIKKTVVGRVSSKTMDDVGLWVESQIEKSNDYFEAIQELVEDGRLGYSSGAIPHLVERKSTGEITSWAVAEFSLTTTPAEPRTIGIEQLRILAETEPAYKAFLPDESEDAKASKALEEAERKQKLGQAKLGSKRINFENNLEEN